jgi:hypothetical protein
MAVVNMQLIGVVGPATRVTVWRRMRRVVMWYAGGRRTIHKDVLWRAINDLEHDLAAGGWRLVIGNGCRSEWTP